MKHTLKSRRGISMVEVIVALTVIVIVSAAALSLITAHTQLEARTIQTIEATNIAENAIECFRYDSSDFKTVFEKTGVSYNEADGTYTSGSLIAYVQTGDNSIKVVVKNAKGDKIADIEYTK